MAKLTLPLQRHINEALETFSSHHTGHDGKSLRRLIPRNKLPYLYRNFLAGKETPDDQPGLLLHKFVSSDAKDELHNHPWRWAVSFILTGSYRETRSNPMRGDYMKHKQVLLGPPQTDDFSAGDHNFIGADTFHSVQLLSEEVWTLFLHGPRIQHWAFVPAIHDGTLQTMRVIKTRTFNARKAVHGSRSM